MQDANVNLYLVGFTGTGKSTVGRQVARQLDFEFFDSDHEIERLAGMTITQMFAEKGEPFFREWERRYIDREHPAQNAVVSCGAGLVIQEGMLANLQSRGVVICLHASLETVIQRTARGVHRPLVQSGDDREERIRRLYAQREATYRRTGTMVLTDHRPLREIVSHVVRIYQREAREWVAKHA